MEMKIEEEKFFMLETGGGKWIYDAEENAISALRQKISENQSLGSDITRRFYGTDKNWLDSKYQLFYL